MFKFERLDVWRKAVDLYKDAVAVSTSIPQPEQFSLGEQLRRAALSVSTNIAEGTGREGSKEAKYFFNIAKGSVYEVVSLLHVVQERGCMKAADHDDFYLRCDEIARMLSGLMHK